jgi:hypothetical protein
LHQCSASYHHFDDITAITQALCAFLKFGGSLLIVDLLKDDSIEVDKIFPGHGEHNLVAHKGGFEIAQIEEAFHTAGLSSFQIEDAIKAHKKGYPVKLFMAQGRKL